MPDEEIMGSRAQDVTLATFLCSAKQGEEANFRGKRPLFCLVS
jgi:hypothetical protein